MEPPSIIVPRRPCMHGWRGLVAISALSVIGIVIAIGVWFASDSDLRVERRMAAMGLPTTWQALGVPKTVLTSDNHQRLITLVARLKPWTPKTLASLNPGEALPDELREWHAKLADVDIIEATRLIDALPTQRPYLRNDFTRFSNPWLTPWKNAIGLFGQRLALAQPGEAREQAHRLICLLNSTPRTPHGTGAAIDASFILLVTKALALRLADLRGDADIAQALMGIAEQVDAEREENCAGELVYLLGQFRDIHSGKAKIPLWSRFRWESRWKRDRVLGAHLTWIGESRACRRGFERYDLAQRLKIIPRDESDMTMWSFLDPLAYEHSSTRARSAALLLAAEIMGDPWPTDPYARDGASLRRLERDGRLIGAYSVGQNGIDDHGGNGDDAFALYGPLKAPHASTTHMPISPKP